MSFGSLTNATAHDVHPPLYYMILKIFILIFGNHGWVYHLVSFVPFALMMVVALTLIKKEFGTWASFILITLCGTMNNAVYNIIEVRDYEWAALFMLLSFTYSFRLFNYKEDTSNLKKNAVLMTVFSLLAAYTFYFCIIAIATVYIILMIYALQNKAILKTVIGIWGATFLIYLPWCIVFFLTLKGNQGKIYSFNSVSLISCIEDIFNTKFSYLILAIFIISSAVVLLFEKNKAQKIWTASGILAFGTTTLIPYIISRINSPIFVSKHLYPAMIILWVLLATNLSILPNVGRISIKPILIGLILFLTVPVGIWGLKTTLLEERAITKKCNEFLNISQEMALDESTVLLSNEDMISLGIGKYYYPDMERLFFDGTKENREQIKENLTSTIMMINQVDYDNSEEMLEYCQNLGYECEKIMERVFFGNYVVDLWKCTNSSLSHS